MVRRMQRGPIKKDDFLYLPLGVRHGVANASGCTSQGNGYGKVPAGMKVEPTAKLMLANAGDVRALGSRQSWPDYAVQATDGTHLQHARQTPFRLRYGQPFHHGFRARRKPTFRTITGQRRKST